MRILFLSRDFPSVFRGMDAVFNAHLCAALAGRHEVQVISPVSWVEELRKPAARRQVPASRRQMDRGLPVELPRYYYTPGILRQHYGTFLWHSIRRSVERLLAEFRPEAVIGYWSHPDGEVALRIARRLGVPGIVMVGGSDILVLAREPRRRKKIAGVLRSADAVIAVSEDLRRHVVEMGVPPAKVHVVRRGVELEQFTSGDRAVARRKLGLPLDKRLLLWVGRMESVKAVDTLIDACAILKQGGIDFHLCLVGSGSLLGEFASQVKRQRLSERVTFAGPVDHPELPDWFRAADLTVLPSLSEGVPNVLLESIACGTPFVASRVGGIPEIADERRDRLVEPGDAHALATAIEKSLAAEAPSEPRRFMPQTWDESALELEDVIEQLRREQAVERDSQRMNAVGTVGQSRRRSARHTWSGPFRQAARRLMAATLPRQMLFVRGPVAPGNVYLTFDDGPHPEHTPRLLDALRSENIKATFFIIGRSAENHPDLVRRIVREGHEFGHHTYLHSDPGAVSATALAREVRQTAELLRRITGRSSRLFRPPHGKVTAAKCARLWAAGQTIVLWNVDPKDFTCRDSAELRSRFEQRLIEPGDVVLLHDNRPYAAEVIPQIAASVRARGLDFANLSQWQAGCNAS